MRNSEIANQLNSQNLDTVIPTTYKTVGGRVFPDARSQDGLADLRDIVDSYRATHAVAYGNVVPSSGVTYSIQPPNNNVTDLIAPDPNEVIHLNGLSFNNESGTDGATIILQLRGATGDATIVTSQINIAPNSNSSWHDLFGINIPDLVLSAGQSLQINITAGESEKTTITASAVKSCL